MAQQDEQQPLQGLNAHTHNKEAQPLQLPLEVYWFGQTLKFSSMPVHIGKIQKGYPPYSSM